VRLTRRGKIVVGLLIALALWGMWEISAHLWYIEGQGYCWGNAMECGL
jgi:hypothetical protein